MTNTIRIPKSGPFSVSHADGTKSDVWYDKGIRLWTHLLLDKNGNQIGPDQDGTANYAHHRSDLVAAVRNLHADIALQTDVDTTFECGGCGKEKQLAQLGQTNWGSADSRQLRCIVCFEAEKTAGRSDNTHVHN